MNFLEYKNNLINNNIMLFDYDYRNSYQNIICLMKEIETADNENIQTGGGSSFYLSPFTIIKRVDNKSDIKKLNMLIDKLVNNNIIGAKYLCKNDLTLNF
jgi:hypothetical protein